MRDRSWTPGPWEWIETSRDNEFTQGHVDGRGGDPVLYGTDRDDEEAWTIDADAALIALAPEMAEAILEMAEYPTLDPEDVFEDVWNKLRAIGATDA